MAEYNTYTIDGQQYICEGDALYVITDETHSYPDIEENEPYLHDGSVVIFDLTHDIIQVTPVQNRDRSYYPADITEDKPDITATPLERVLPDGIEPCPECGGWFGPEDTDELNWCSQCGYDDEDQN